MLTAHQPNYLPYPGFFQKLAAADEFLIVDTTQFVKRGPFGWIHRNRIRTPNGPIWLTLPVLSKGRYSQAIEETEFNPRVDWARKHWKSLEFSYRKAPYWERYAPSLKELYEASWSHLSPFTSAIIGWFLEQLDLHPQVHIASELASSGKSTDYIVKFCQELGATKFLSGKHGRDYLETDSFREAGIELHFQSYSPPQYEAGEEDSSGDNENLSLIDMLFWCGDAAVEWVHNVPESVTA